MNKLLYALLLLFACQIAQAKSKFFEGKIFLSDGTTFFGLTEIPSGPYDKTIRFKDKRDAKAIPIASSKIDSIFIFKENHAQNRFDLMTKFVFGKCELYDVKKNTVDTKNKKIWLNIAWNTKLMEVYCVADFYEINEDGKLKATGAYRIDFYLKKKEAENYFLVYNYLGDNKQEYFNVSCSYYFKDIPKLSRYLANGGYKWDEVYRVAEAYERYKKSAE